MSCVKWIGWFLLLPFCCTQFLFPDVAELGSSLLLTCAHSGSDVIYINTPYGTTVTCILPSCASKDSRLDNTTVNTTHVILDVNKVQNKDGGTWTCGPRDDQTPCKLTVFQVPSCNISSEADTDKLHIGEEISLSVAIEDYFCSDLVDFQLQTGLVTEKLVEDLRIDVANSTDVFNYTFNISDSHIGSVELLFSCNTARKRITCGGVKSLMITGVMPQGFRKDQTVAIVAGTIAAVVFIITVLLITWYIFTRRRNCSKTSTMGNESCYYADVADSVHARPKSMRSDNGEYDEITDIPGSFGNTTCESQRSKRYIQLVPNEAYSGVDEV